MRYCVVQNWACLSDKSHPRKKQKQKDFGPDKYYFFLDKYYFKISFFHHPPLSGIFSCVSTVDIVMCLYTWHSPNITTKPGL